MEDFELVLRPTKDFDVMKEVFPDRGITRDELTTIEHIFKRAVIQKREGFLSTDPFPLKHTFAEGLYVREIRVPAGSLIVTELFKQSHATFLLQGEVSVMTEDGKSRIKAPGQWITPAGVKRLIFTHSDVIWTTVHSNPNDSRDVEVVRQIVISPSYEELESNIIDIISHNKEDLPWHGSQQP
jgi:hypothetical protein